MTSDQLKILKSKMVLNGFTRRDLAKLLGLSVSSISQKLCGRQAFSLEQIKKVAEALKLSEDEIIKIFLSF